MRGPEGRTDVTAKIKSAIVYRQIGQVFQPWCRQQGFRRVRSSRAAWYREHDPKVYRRRFLCFWFQVSAWDNSFTSEFQLAHEPRMSHYGRRRIGWVLNEEDRRTVLTRESEIRERLRAPEISSSSWSSPSDVWFSYAEPQDVTAWAELLQTLWPRLLDSFSELDVDRRDPG